MSDEPIPVAVVGAGDMGANHVRVYDELPEAELVGVVEPDEERARAISSEYDVIVVERISDLEGVRAATVAVPSQLHREVAKKCLNAGMDILVEKPLATTVADAEAIINAATEADAVLQVGHIERFNPAVETLRDMLSDMTILAIETHRLGPFNEHLVQESVVSDLLIHDIDIVRSLVDGNVQTIRGMGLRQRSETWDHATAMLKFPESVAVLTASHVTHGKVRTLTLTAEECFIRLDYQSQELEVQQHGSEQTTASILGQSGYRTETTTETPFVSTREPLKNELEHFLACVRNRTDPAVSGLDGVEAVRLVERIDSVLE